ncbi:sugar ABC transporter ATP-binding protein [Diplocloster agilis]|uniref:sugar ABC transporter ATP-binding protein n=1 Tax=Diplocloster agilis TaxID=2850323 RepID=UPI0008221048|nr:sugar ABC transporter ATP-binding protein [Suonthocola fibrivorans]MCU6735695.1 sugar ABC transporter ATP-binding protein [Suonthocola fibrivorans]SCJ79955.1 Ribose import ATP-binding protein RbsA [uncultured Clostridium sp.]
MNEPFIRLRNISKSFAGVKALKNIGLEICPGEIHCLIGENGCGKSTLIKIISGVYAPDSGTIELDGRLIKHMTPKEAMKNGIEVIYQDFSVFPNLTVAENISLNTQITEKQKVVNWNKIRVQAQAALDKIGVSIPLYETVEHLSVANRQLIAISRAIAHNARLLIMDEPTTALTQREVDALFQVVCGLNKEGISVIFVSHKLDEVMQLSQKIMIIRNGETAAEGNIEDFTKEKIIYYMTGRELAGTSYEVPAGSQAKTVLKVDNISQKGGFHNVSFELREHEIIGVTGLLGSGRTALANALFGIHRIDSGEIHMDGKKIKLRNVRSAVKSGIAYVPEDRLTEGLFLEQSIGRNLTITVLDKLKKKSGALDRAKGKSISQYWIEKLHIKTASEELPARALSGGNQQKIVIAKWLAKQPKVLILNGPTVGVDIAAKTDIIELIKSLAQDNMSILLVSDDVSEIMMCCNRVMLMKNGRITEEFKTSDITEKMLYEKVRMQEV